jgi:hypothetical protein
MRYPWSLDHTRAFQLDVPGAKVVEKPDAFSEQDGHQVDAYLVDLPGLDALLRNFGAAHADGLVASDRFRLLDGAFDAVRDEGERRCFVNPFFWDPMGSETLSVMPPLGTLYSVWPPKYRSKSDPTSPSGPAMKPSSEVENPVLTFPKFIPLSMP